MHILVCSPSYPTSKSIDFVFVDQLCRAFADNGHKVTVIAPQSITKCLLRHIPIVKCHSYYSTSKGNKIELYRPYHITLGNSGHKWLKNSFQNAVARAFGKMSQKPDVCYGHFWQSMFALYPLAMKNSIPLFGASGEENVGYYVSKPNDFKAGVKQYISGLVNVSSKNREECLSLDLISEEKSRVIPNAIDNFLFYKRDKSEMRRKYGYDENDFIVAFTGQFVPRKGTIRLSDALTKLNDKKIKAIFMGRGSEEPTYEGTLLKGAVNHDLLPEYLSCADVFVLPTENEGCSNAIIEAMACGLPIISTDAAFNHDILNENNSIMIDCHNIDQIAEAIKTLNDDNTLRERLAEGALQTASGLTISKRAENIVEFIKSKIK